MRISDWSSDVCSSDLVNQHSIANAADAEAYLSRCNDFAVQLDNETGRIKADHAAGIIPPDFVVDRTLALFDNIWKPAPDANILTTKIGRASCRARVCQYV